MLTATTIAQRSSIWLQEAKNQLKARTKEHLYKRINIVEEIINDNLPSITKQFTMNDSTRQLICNKLFIKIRQYTGTKQLRNGQEKSQADVIKKTRTWWNRTKATSLGSILFAQICFLELHHFIDEECNWLSRLKRLKLFITIFNGFLSHSVKFPQTKPQPLIPHACFCVDGDFKNICYAFVETFGDSNIKWNPYTKKFRVQIKNGKKKYEYIKGKHRCLRLFTDFVQCLNQIFIKYKFGNDTEEILLMKWNATINNVQLQTDIIEPVSVPSDINDIKLSAMCTIVVECHSDHESTPSSTSTNMNNQFIVEGSEYLPLDYTNQRPFQLSNEYLYPTNRVHFLMEENHSKNKTNAKIEKHIKSMRDSMFENESIIFENEYYNVTV